MSNDSTLRCLAVRNPWAWAICLGEHQTENRTWTTSHRGVIAIHASSTPAEVNRLHKRDGTGAVRKKLFQYGAIIGLADIEDVVEYGPALEANPWASGPYCWLMRNGRFLQEPIPLKGRLTLFHLPEEIAAQVLAQPTHQLDPQDPVIRACADAIRPELNPADHYSFAAEHFLDKGEFGKARQACAEWLRHEPRSADAHVLIGYLAQAANDDQQALDHYTAALAIDGQRVIAQVQRGDVHFFRGNFELAWQDYLAASEQDPEWGVPFVGMAAVMNARGEFADAVQACDRGVELTPDLPMAHLRRAEANLGLKAYEIAIADATEVLRHVPDLYEAYLLRGQAHAALGQTEQAAQDLAEAKKLQPIET